MFKWLKKFTDLTSITTPDAQIRGYGYQGATWTPNQYDRLSYEGYCRNVIAYHCISEIATSAADIPIIIKIDGEEIEDDGATSNSTYSPIVNLINRPNPKQSYKPFMVEAISHRLISGSTYIHLLKSEIRTNIPQELTLLRPDRVFIEISSIGIPYRYRYTIYGHTYFYDIDPNSIIGEVLQIKCFHPLDDLYGFGDLSAASMAIDQFNESSKWNKQLLQNASKPAGILSLKDRADNAPILTPQQQQNLSRQVNEKFSGIENSGKIITLNYDMQWQSLSFSPIDMDWLNGKNSNAREICLAFGYPSFLLGLPDSNSTYNNVEQAYLALYEKTIIPTLNSILSEMSYWLSETLNMNLELCPDLDRVSALAPRREMARNNARLDLAAGIITTNEAREEIDYEPLDIPEADQIFVAAGKLPLDFNTESLNKDLNATNTVDTSTTEGE